MYLLLINLSFWVLFSKKENSLGVTLPISFRIQNGILSVLLVLWGGDGIDSTWFLILRPLQFIDMYYKPMVFIHPAVSLAIHAAGALSYVVYFNLGLWMFLRRERAYRVIHSLAPLLFVVSYADFFLSWHRFHGDRGYWVGVLLGFGSYFCFFWWLYIYSGRQTVKGDAVDAGTHDNCETR
jgi:hypothetical protein